MKKVNIRKTIKSAQDDKIGLEEVNPFILKLMRLGFEGGKLHATLLDDTGRAIGTVTGISFLGGSYRLQRKDGEQRIPKKEAKKYSLKIY